MGIQAWMIKSWPICQWYLLDGERRWPEFEHAHTQVRPDLDHDGRRIGETIWQTVIDGQDAAAAWEWTEFAPGAVMISNPNAVSTNLRLIDARHRKLDTLHEIIALNSIVHALPWREPVRAALLAAPSNAAARP